MRAAVSAPPPTHFLNLLPDLCSLLLYLLDFAEFLLPGFVLALLLSRRRPMSAVHALITVLTASATLGYIGFWIFFESKLLGRAFSLACFAASLFVLAFSVKRAARAKALAQLVAVPLIYVAITGIVYLSLFYLSANPFSERFDLANVRFSSTIRPGDNLIPLIFAEKIYSHEPIRPFCCGDWLSSDRPPLQSGMFLLIRPLRIIGSVGLNYQLLGTALQCLWICGVWALLVVLRAPPLRIKQILAFLIFSGFFFYNSVYVWPKLLAAAFILFALAIVLDIWDSDRPITNFETTLAALSVSLALLAHPGSVFSLPAFLLLLARKRKLFHFRQCASAALLIALFFTPWIAYQKFYDPPGNRLLKMHLAGVIAIDSRSTWQALVDAYTQPTLRTLAEAKWGNLKTLIGPKPFDELGVTAIRVKNGLHLDREVAESTRFAQREYIWSAVGLFNFGWLAALLWFLRKNKPPRLPHARLLVLLALLNVAIWSIVQYGPGYTFTTEASYANMLLLSIGLLGFLLTLPRVAIVSLFVLEIFNLLVVWVC